MDFFFFFFNLHSYTLFCHFDEILILFYVLCINMEKVVFKNLLPSILFCHLDEILPSFFFALCINIEEVPFFFFCLLDEKLTLFSLVRVKDSGVLIFGGPVKEWI